jgi:folylpolyglutamate synthase/dihydropteroate synthase
MKTEKIINAEGIYPTKIIDPGKATPEDWQRADNANSQMDLDRQLAEIERDALAKQPYLRCQIELASNYLDDSNDLIRNDAGTVIAGIRELRKLIEQGEIKRAAAVALMIGRLDERIHARQFEPDVAHSRRSKKALCKGRDEKKQQATNRYAEIRAKVQTVFDANLKNTLTYARQSVASQLDISFDTVKRATAGMRPRKKIKK